MFQNAQTHLVAPVFRSPIRLEAPVFEPWHDLTTEIDRLVSAARRPDDTLAPADGAGADAARGAETVNAWVPAVDVEEGEDAVRLAVEVPGVDPDALEVTVDDRVLTVRGERPLPVREGQAGKRAFRLERRYGRFARSLTLPLTVDSGRIQARYEHGVLHLELPKRPEAKPRRIAIAPAEADHRRLDSSAAAV